MNALTAIAATVYAVTLWMFAPESVWRREVETAKRNQQQRLTASPEPAPESIPQEPQPQPQVETTPKLETVPTPEPQAIPEAIKRAIPIITGTDYTGWTTAKLRDEAKTRKLNWRPLINGKRTPLKKPDLIALLTT